MGKAVAKIRVPGIVAVVLWMAALLPADVIVLHNGDRIEGQIISETTDEIKLWRTFATGNIKYVQTIKCFQIAGIERKDVVPASKPVAEIPQQPDSPPATETVADRRALLDSAIAKYKRQEYESAGVDLTRLINNSTRDQLDTESSPEVERQVEMSLADLTAEAHFRAAIVRGQGHTFRLRYVTAYEKPSLVPRLIDAFTEGLQKKIRSPSKKPVDEQNVVPKVASRPAQAMEVKKNREKEADGDTADIPAEQVDTISNWLDRPNDYDGDKAAADALAGEIRYAIGLLSERMRIDPAVKKDRSLKATLAADKVHLLDLLELVAARSRGALTPAGRAEIQAEKERLRTWYLKAVEDNQKKQWENYQNAKKLAEQLEKDEKQKEKGKMLLPWLGSKDQENSSEPQQ